MAAFSYGRGGKLYRYYHHRFSWRCLDFDLIPVSA